MKCIFCNKTTGLYSVFIKSGVKEDEIKICENCAKKKDIELESRIMPGSVDAILSFILEKDGDKRCENCKTKLAKIEATGKVGCSKCYKYFREEIKNLMKYKNFEYLGKIPSEVKGKKKIIDYKMKLKESLEKAILKEDYENAVKIREKLNGISGECEDAD